MMRGWLAQAVVALTVVAGTVMVGSAPTPGISSSAPPPSAAPFWRFLQGRTPPSQLKIMNYYPADAGWTQMWTSYQHNRTDADFAAIADLGANTVRIIIQPAGVGWPTVTDEGAADLRDMVDTAERHGLGVELTLFDLWYSWNDIAASQSWVNQLLSPYAGDNRIGLVELQNELPTTYAPAVTWAKAMLPYLATVLPGVPRSVSANSSASLQVIGSSIPASDLDVVDVHLYGSTAAMAGILAAAHALAGGRPVIVGESGASTAAATGGSDATQLAFYKNLLAVVEKAGLHWFSPWILSDFEPSAMPSWLRTPTEESFGLRRLDGSYKPAAAVVRAMFAAP